MYKQIVSISGQNQITNKISFFKDSVRTNSLSIFFHEEWWEKKSESNIKLASSSPKSSIPQACRESRKRTSKRPYQILAQYLKHKHDHLLNTNKTINHQYQPINTIKL